MNEDVNDGTRSFLGLGSNLGDRLSYLKSALEALRRGSFSRVRAVSPVYETAPVDVFEDQPTYLNCVAEIFCSASAIELMRFCEGVEAALGRENKGGRKPRTIDIDILLFGEERMENPHLQLPHPGVVRAFNILGIAASAEDAQSIYIPGFGTIGELLGAISEREMAGVRLHEESL